MQIPSLKKLGIFYLKSALADFYLNFTRSGKYHCCHKDSRALGARSEGAKSSREGSFYSFQAVTGGGDRLKRRGGSDLCGGRLKALP